MPEPIGKGSNSNAPAEIVDPWKDDVAVENAPEEQISLVTESVDPWAEARPRSAGESSGEDEIMDQWNPAPTANPGKRMDEYKDSEVVNPWER